ncbi:MAG TPA: hypothetical protein VF292_06160 [Rhodanobacteraceae bacterium]
MPSALAVCAPKLPRIGAHGGVSTVVEAFVEQDMIYIKYSKRVKLPLLQRAFASPSPTGNTKT